ncbi:MAG: metal ABC transporter permease [Campylobacterota bacterium]|nr:metal ABC transporter permease [Campylobacterota bacterium]
MLEILSYTFIQNAIIAGVLVSFASGIIGSLIVVNRMVFLAGGIAHASYGGIGLAVYFSLPIFLTASVFSAAVSLIVAYVALKQNNRIDTVIGLIWAVGMAIGIILIDLTPGYNVDLMSYLFGSIMAVSSEDITYMSILLFIIIFVVGYWYKNILAVSYDKEYASLRGINVKLFFSIILVLCSLTIVMAIKVVGLILVIALLTIPIYIAEKLSNSLYMMMFISGVLSSVFTFIGLYLSYSYDISSGASIIIISASMLLLFLIYQKIRGKLNE